ncbi:MAG: peptidoglycan DD-metalloendopeptidase family protein [Helicobacteraceae bacterium]|nr:peptidoglycan DD-metalloendopeptidase family protein [Helicobacteraceae bacterium]
MFLERLNVPQKLYYNLDREDQILTEEIYSGSKYQIMYDNNDSIEQVLIPITEDLQLHIYKDKDKKFAFDALPIVDDVQTEAFVVEIQNSPAYDIQQATKSRKLTHAFISAFKNSLNFHRNLRKGDKLVMVYEQRYRLGKPISTPVVKVAMIEMRNKEHFIYLNSDRRHYDARGAEVEGFMLGRPVAGARVSSRFQKRRFHPILKRYRAHLGVDYAARRGTPIKAAGNGTVTFRGYTRGYGNLTKIRHSDGYMTLYAHQKSFRKNIRRGKKVKKGQVIGYVGSTGMSTGPHLHFGLYKNNRAINPAQVIRLTVKKLKGKKRKEFNAIKEEYNSLVKDHLSKNTKAKVFQDFSSSTLIDLKTLKKVDS